MADEDHVDMLSNGVRAWNKWREAHPGQRVNLSGANLQGANLEGFNLSLANLAHSDLLKADLRRANLCGARLEYAGLGGANLVGADLSSAQAPEAWFVGANLTKVDLHYANLRGSQFYGSNLTGANLTSASFHEADLREANLTRALMTKTHLQFARLVRTNLSGAKMDGCTIYGISAWDVIIDKSTKQSNLIITPLHKTLVDNIEVGQFIYLFLNNEKIRDVVDTITSKAVLILGRFTPERKAVLEALRGELRLRDRAPILFDFSVPRSKSTTDTVKLLAQMARYIIIDLSNPNSAPYELGVISMMGLKTTPVVPIILSTQKPFPMLQDVLNERWSTELITYRDLDDLRMLLDGKLVSAAEAKFLELRGLKSQ